MIGKLLDDLVGAAGDVVNVATLPVAVVASVAREITKPIADSAADAAKAVSDGVAVRDGMTGR